MSRQFIQQFAEPSGRIIRDLNGNGAFSVLGAAPTASAAGYSKGGLFIDNSGGVAYYNDGTAASATWRAFVGLGDTNAFTGLNSFAAMTTFTGGITVTTLGITITDVDITLSATTGTKLGAATDKLGFWGATPIVQPANTVDYVTGLVNAGLRASGGTASATFPGALTSSSPTAGMGYSTGAGGTVTQSTNRSTGVTINTVCGAITTNNASLAAAAFADFVVTNSTVGANDLPQVAIKPGGTGSPVASVVNVAAGSFTIRVLNQHAATADTSADVINFRIDKGVTS